MKNIWITLNVKLIITSLDIITALIYVNNNIEIILNILKKIRLL